MQKPYQDTIERVSRETRTHGQGKRKRSNKTMEEKVTKELEKRLSYFFQNLESSFHQLSGTMDLIGRQLEGIEKDVGLLKSQTEEDERIRQSKINRLGTHDWGDNTHNNPLNIDVVVSINNDHGEENIEKEEKEEALKGGRETEIRKVEEEKAVIIENEENNEEARGDAGGKENAEIRGFAKLAEGEYIVEEQEVYRGECILGDSEVYMSEEFYTFHSMLEHFND